MRRQKSVKRLLLSIFLLMLAVTMLCLAVCGGYALYASEQDLMFYNQATLDLCLNDLAHSMKDLQSFNEDIFANDLDYLALSMEGLYTSPNQRMQLEANLHRLIRSRTQDISGMMLFSARSRKSYYWFGDDFLGGMVNGRNTQKMREIRALWLSEDAPDLQQWVSYCDGESTLMMNVSCKRDLYFCTMVDIGAYAARYHIQTRMDAIEFAFLTRESVMTNQSYVQEHDITLEDMLAAEKETFYKNNANVLQTRFDEDLGVGLCGIISLSGVWSHLRLYAMLLAGAMLVIVLLFISIYHMLKQMVVFPLNQITDATRQVAEGVTEIQSRPESIREFIEIQTALERLVQQKVLQENETMRQRSQKEHALLQYYQLQTRSHFFLNCLKSIHGLTMQGEREKTLNVIGLFSNHLRYVFHDSLSFVTVSAELNEVHDYFGIIEMERSDHILLEQNVDPSLLEFPVPPLILQTFLENFNKHNVQSGKILRFRIQIDRVRMEGQDYVRIRMQDNGVGYSEEALQSLQRADGLFEQYHVGVQNLCRRMDILYQGRYQKMFLNHPSGGALTTFYLPVDAELPSDAKEWEEKS